MQGVLGLFILLVIILITNPGFYNNMYNNVLGRVVLIAILIFFATNNVTLGLLVALIIIIGTNIYFIEGMDTMAGEGVTGEGATGEGVTGEGVTGKSTTNKATTSKAATSKAATSKSAITSAELELSGSKGTTIGDDGVTPDSSITTKKIIVTPSKKLGNDRQSLEETIKAKPSSQIPVAKENFTSTEVTAFDEHGLSEGFVSQYGSF
jgi:hypothetical protein